MVENQKIDDIKSVLRRLGVKTSNQGYQYTAYGILLALKNKDSLAYITKSLYIDIAIEFHTSWKCVERNIRTIVDSIWKTDNVELLTQICNGNRIPRPANKEFFNLMCQYFERKSLKETSKKESSNPGRCSQTGMDCLQLASLQKEILSLQKEIQELNHTISWMHDLIWELLAKMK